MAQRDNSKLLNYTTEVEPTKTAGEIIGILAAKGAQSIMIDYRQGEPTGIAFKIAVRGRDVGFRLPCNVEGAYKAMQRMNIAPRFKEEGQAKRTAWRILKNWVEAQMAIIECGQAEMAEVFLAYAITETGQTLFQRYTQDPTRMLGAGEPDRDYNVIEGRFLASGE
ncbi:MAG: hypothetical protein M3348_01715 [Acidobacteriota bacterium]|nr:hypothetical protein [Acidobacteriota bacterium]